MNNRREDESEHKLHVIRAYIEHERERRRITELSTMPLPELSCFGYGEFFNLVERQLMYTNEGFGGWKELSNPEILDGAYRYVAEGKRG
ncbi:MAG: hypothetical protein A2934_02935 [Candidatus Sungbacteria bacterium RIFCSPLOWO2_01_FULL_47_10]|uniref:Uncharacterized protein n=1 Tax=Candidatus Sungbacteria bacterium RIFCSPLOWO2_01_FULL_47_10 TaxID=1802276 RepID=A0A1G2LAE2_9BACT|nr:MAG: hypothetical protein A2934_02935 [Candidatus Sungbacteria bacterium RIFCSPLOWO2_01_FULL_47_10]